MSDEQRVRTMAGWIGVEISKSRVRTPGKAGYGLYRVRGYRLDQQRDRGASRIRRPETVAVPCAWTPYAYALGEIERGVSRAIEEGTPDGPADLGPILTPVVFLGHELVPAMEIPTRWTSAYRGRRDLGDVWSACSGCNRQDETGRPCPRHPDAGELLERSTVRSRQRALNAGFQKEHLRHREWGLRQRHGRKLMDNRRRDNGEAPPAR